MKRFYLVDEKSINTQNQEKIDSNVLMFEFSERGNDFVGRANKDHVNKFPVEFNQFMEAHPDFKLPFALEEGTIGVVSHTEV